VSAGRQLISCPACQSPLIQIECCHPFGQAGALLERRCPECDYEDELAVAMVVADVLQEHAAELATSLEEFANRLESAAELWISR
jgi:hypothetical protein